MTNDMDQDEIVWNLLNELTNDPRVGKSSAHKSICAATHIPHSLSFSLTR